MHPLLRTLLLLSPTLTLHAQSLVTAEIQHGNDAQSTVAVDANAAGDIFAGVGFYDDLDADPGPGTVILNSAGSQDVAIIKLDADGDYLWGKQLGGTGFQSLSDLVTDPAGNVYVFGYFNGTMDMDPGPGTVNLMSAGSDDLFVGKYSPAGNHLWSCKFGGTGTEQNYGFDLDSDGDPVIHGYFQNTVDFNPGPGTFNLTAAVGGSTFVVKLQDDGTFDYAIAMGAIYGNQLRTDASDNIYITGLFWGTIDFDPGPSVFNMSAAGFGNDAFVLKLSPTAAFNWAGKIGGSGAEQGTDLVMDPDNNTITIGGFYDNTIDTDPGPGTANLNTAGGIDAFLVQWNAATGAFLWSKSIGGLGYQAILAIDQQPDGALHLAGSFEQTADFDGGPGTANLTSAGGTDIFKASYSNTGAYISAEKIGAGNGDGAQSIRLDASGAILLCGYFDGNVDFDPGPAAFNLNSAFTGWDGFVAKYCTVYNINTNVTICAGESYFAGGAWQTEPGVYVDYFTPAEGCDSIVTTNLSVNAPIVSLGADVTLCAGTTITLNAGNPGATYLWNTGATTQTITVAAAGTYSVTITDAAGCAASDAITIAFTPAPVVNLGADAVICAGETITLNAGNPGLTYLWNTGATTQTITVNATGTYSVTVTNPAGCTGTDAIVVNVAANPVADLGADDFICSGGSLVLDAGNPGATYNWNTGATTQTITITSAGTYTVTVTNPAGCTDTDAITITSAPSPTVDLGPNQTICAGTVITLDAGNPGANYLWNTGATTQTISASVAGNYSVTVTNAFGCTDADIMHLSVADVPDAVLPETLSVCADATATLDAGNTGADFNWNTGATTQTITITTPGWYVVDITNAEGCSTADSTLVNILPLPSIDLGADTGVCDGATITLDATWPDADYIWNTGATGATLEVDASGWYAVTVTDASGCSAVDSVWVEMYAAPAIELGADGAYCADDTVVLDAFADGSTYAWNTGAETASIMVTESGTYFVTVTTADGCTATDTVNITIHPLPVADLGDDITTCSNAPVILDATTPFCTYAWSTGETTGSILAEEPGTYWVSVTNSFGCQLIDSITLIHLEAPEATLVLPFSEVCIDAAPLTLSGGSPDGGAYFGEGVSDGLFDPSATGTGTWEIYYTYTDMNGCSDTAMQSITVTVCQDIQELNTGGFAVFPNPAINYCVLRTDIFIPDAWISISDLSGHVVQRSALTDTQQQIDLSTLPGGHYIITVQTPSGSRHRMLTVADE